VLWAFVHDTVGPRIRTIESVDSVTVRITFSQTLDPARPGRTRPRYTVFALPDTTPVACGAVSAGPVRFDPDAGASGPTR